MVWRFHLEHRSNCILGLKSTVSFPSRIDEVGCDFRIVIGLSKSTISLPRMTMVPSNNQTVIIIDDSDDDDTDLTSYNCPAPRQPPAVSLSPTRFPSCVSLLELNEDASENAMIQPHPPSVTHRSSFHHRFNIPDYNQRSRNSYPTRHTSSVLSPLEQKRQDSLPNRGPSNSISQYPATSTDFQAELPRALNFSPQLEVPPLPFPRKKSSLPKALTRELISESSCYRNIKRKLDRRELPTQHDIDKYLLVYGTFRGRLRKDLDSFLKEINKDKTGSEQITFDFRPLVRAGLQAATQYNVEGFKTAFNTGTANNPIMFDSEVATASTNLQVLPASENGSNSRSSRAESGQAIRRSVDMSDANSAPPGRRLEQGQESIVERNLAQTVHDMEVIDLDELEDDLEDELRIFAADDTHSENDPARTRSRPARATPNLVRRNPSITEPWVSKPSFEHESRFLKRGITVELLDGDFLRITDIIWNSETDVIRIRGNQLQRTLDLNGVLERKMNEVVLRLEVDLDDPRPHMKQSATEVKLSDIRRIRDLRLTNQKFPLDRNVDPAHFRGNRDLIKSEGGLTCRWVYTCIFATGADRYHNIFKERRLERLRHAECTSTDALADSDRRFQWRGRTIPGGAHRPTILTAASQLPPEFVEEPAILIDDELDFGGRGPWPQTYHSFGSQYLLPRTRFEPQNFDRTRVQKRRRTDHESITSLDDQQRPKRPRPSYGAAVEEARQCMATATLQRDVDEPEDLGAPLIVLDNPITTLAKNQKPLTDYWDRVCSKRTKALEPAPINLLSSDLSIPPPSGSIHRPSLVPPRRVHRLPGQKLTYGDAFCGGGGSTRGATMAGLQVKWGFDFNKNAIASWQANFPHARGYNVSSHDFVSGVQNSSKKHLFKVDILHLSPPCQFFSPAHTLQGKDDDMNIASLFAVQSVIDVARPRVVTLEQTFGIVQERFRWFFNALIHMFTSHEFSVRWAVIPFQDWGLPQRRMRLIMIASCPGEPLPSMPAPTHTSNPPPFSTLSPHVSVNSILRTIPANSPDHEPVFYAPNRRLTPWDGNKILPRAMTTHGGQNCHPSGRRDFTLCEYARLQGFPQTHVWRGSHVKRQIGNAVPPVVAKVLFESIRRDLDRLDGIVEGVEVLD